MAAKRAGSSSKGIDETSGEMRALFGANFRQARLKARLTQVAMGAVSRGRRYECE
jgi:hypothetical protein